MFHDPTGMRGEPKPGGPGKGILLEELIIIVKIKPNKVSQFRTKTAEWVQDNIRGPLSGWFDKNTREPSQRNIREPLSNWFDENTREPARNFTKPLRDAFEWTPERTAAYNQFLEVNGVNEEKAVLNSVMRDYGALYGADMVLPAVSRSIATSFKTLETNKQIEEKLMNYLLNKNHPIGASKADWFEKALGFNQTNMKDLAKQIGFNLKEALFQRNNGFGDLYQTINKIKGANGRFINVRFNWILKEGKTAELVGALPPK